MFYMEQNTYVQWNKKCPFKILDKLKLTKAICGQSVTFCGKNNRIGWPIVAFCGRVCVVVLSDLFMVLYGIFMVVYGKISILLDLYSLFSRS